MLVEVLRLVRKDGSQVWTSLRMAEMRDDGEVLGYVGAITDVTQERAARLAIDRAQQDLRRVIECSPEGIAVVRDGRWIFVNRAMLEALGYTRPEELLGQTPARSSTRTTARARSSSPADRCRASARARSSAIERPTASTR